MKCISSSDRYLVGADISRDALLLEGYKHSYIRDRAVHLYTRGNIYIELSDYTFDETMEFLEQGN